MEAFSPPLPGFPPISMLFSTPWIKSDAVCATILHPSHPSHHPHPLVSAFGYFHKATLLSWLIENTWMSYMWRASTKSTLELAKDLMQNIIMTQSRTNKATASVLQSSPSEMIESSFQVPLLHFLLIWCLLFSLYAKSQHPSSPLNSNLKRGASYHALHLCQARAMRSN